jgi:uncharacterized protein (TIGR02217 family)
MVPAMAFAPAPRMHSGGMAGLRNDEVPAILQRGERVPSRRESQAFGAGGGVNVTIMARDAESFRQSGTQVAADKDWGDDKSGLPSETTGPTDEALGTGDSTTTAFQLVKRYASGAQSWTRAITKPVQGTVRIALAGIEQPSGWSVDTTTGLLTFSVAPGAGVAITAGFEFDVPVRFDTDVLDVTPDRARLGSITSIPLLELRR